MKKMILVMITTALISSCASRKKVDVDSMVREPAEQNDSAVEIVPLLPPGVKSLLDEAEQARIAGNEQQAIEILHRARSIAGNTPTVLQYLAEAYLMVGDFPQALAWAQQAVDNGPAKGALCERSRRTLALAAEQQGQTDVQLRALQSIESCISGSIQRF